MREVTNFSLFNSRRVLIFGLGLLGGGIAATNWFLKQGAKVTVTDLKTKKQLASSIRKIRGQVKLRLSGHSKKDIRENEVVVLNPDVSLNSPFIKYARRLGKQIENEATIFYKLFKKPIIAITGTRGKTTTANWTGHFLSARHKTIVTGNSPIQPLLQSLDKTSRYELVVNEIPSFHLELFNKIIPAPQIAVITNLFQDHLNRHGSMQGYAQAKAKIFANQNSTQHLILNYDSKWTNFFLKLKPKARVWFFSTKKLPKQVSGIFVRQNHIWFQEKGSIGKVLSIGDFAEKWGGHNIENLLASALAANLTRVSWAQIQKEIKTLPQVPFRQQIVFQSKRLTIINDTTATSPDGAIAAVRHFGSSATVLIAGGTDRNLDFKEWGRVVPRYIRPTNMVLLEGSATQKMIRSLGKKGRQIPVFDTLRQCLKAALDKAKKFKQAMIVFSPGAKSFEKFKNEFDRGVKFNRLIKRLVGQSQSV